MTLDSGDQPTTARRRIASSVRTAWSDIRGDPVRLLPLALLVVAVVVCAWWIARERGTPQWDQSHYLDDMWRYRTALSSKGIGEFLRTVRDADPTHAPLFPLLAFPASFVFGDGVRSALLLNVILLPILIFVSGEIATTVFGRRARLLTMFLVATTPLIVGLSHEVLQDFLLTTAVAVAALCVLKTQLLTRRSVCVFAGIAIGLGMLTKVTFLLYVSGPLMVTAVAYVMSVRRATNPETPAHVPRSWLRSLRPGVVNGLFMTGVALVIAAPWYIVNWGPTIDYLDSTTSGPLLIGVGPANPFQVREVVVFTETVLEGNLSWLYTFVGLIAIVIAIPRFVAWARRRENVADTLTRAAFLITWAGIPFLVFTFSSDHDPRYLGATMPAVAIIIAALIIQIPRRWVRAAMITAVVVVGVFEVTVTSTDWQPPLLPAAITFDVPYGSATIPLAGQPIGYERRPKPVDFALPIMDYLVSRSRKPDGSILARKICILEVDPVVNGNTLVWFTHVDGLPFTYFDQFTTSSRSAQLDQLSSCDFVLYIKPPKVPAALRGDRIVLLNEQSAASRMTPRMFALFTGPSKRFPVDDGLVVSVLERNTTPAH